MSKKKKKNKETTIENYYDLKTKEVDELVAALKGELDETEAEPVPTNIAEITGEEQKVKPGSKKADFDPYKIDKLSRIPVWVKAIFIKWWFAGAVCYFILMGLGRVVTDALDQAVLAGCVLGIFTDIFVNPIFRYMESSEKEYNKYMMFPFPFKQFWTFFTNIIYYLVVGLLVMLMYGGINQLFNLINNNYDGYVTIAVGPLIYGTFCVMVDMAFIGIKDLIVFLVKRAKRKKAEEKGLADVFEDAAESKEEKRDV
ncbi:MAG: hypothetical protein K2O44_03485 [Clostridia bacterium]|nr:hypothetical protein [Clostridia bacterium]